MLQWWNTDELLKVKNTYKYEYHESEASKQDIAKDLMELVEDGPTREWIFNVRAECEQGESMCVVGSTKSLGFWKTNRSLLLKKDVSE